MDYTQRRRDAPRQDFAAGLNLKTRTLDQQRPRSCHRQEEPLREMDDKYSNIYNREETRNQYDYKYQQPQKKERDNTSHLVSKYSFDGRSADQPQDNPVSPSLASRDQPSRTKQQDSLREAYYSNKRNQRILMESGHRRVGSMCYQGTPGLTTSAVTPTRRGAVDRKQNNPDNLNRQDFPMDRQMVEKMYNITKLNSRISERLKKLSENFDRHR